MSDVGRKVLLVEDDPDLRILFRNALRAVGFDPISAGAAEDGLALLEEEQCSLAIIDMRLPGMSGLEALSTFKAKRPELPLLAMTAARDTTEALVRMHGASSIIYKPFRTETLLEKIRACLKAEGEGGSADEPRLRL